MGPNQFRRLLLCSQVSPGGLGVEVNPTRKEQPRIPVSGVGSAQRPHCSSAVLQGSGGLGNDSQRAREGNSPDLCHSLISVV